MWKVSYKITRGKEAGEGAGSVGLVSYVPVWLSEVHQTYNLAHGSIIDYINNNIGSENKRGLAVIYISHRAHHWQFSVPWDAWLIGGRVQNPCLPKKVCKLAQTFLKSFLRNRFPVSFRQVPHVLRTFYWHTLEQPTRKSRTSPLASLPWRNVPGNRGKKNHTSSQSSHNSLCSVRLSRDRWTDTWAKREGSRKLQRNPISLLKIHSQAKPHQASLVC